MLKWMTAGESHGPALVAVMEGLPSGVPVTTEMISSALEERRAGYGRGARQKFEMDKVRILSGVRHGFTTGAPLAVEIGNSEWSKWKAVMSADPVPLDALEVDAGRGDTREQSRNAVLLSPRPGHADLPGMVSYRFEDARNVLERASARETAARVALGAIARSFLQEVSGIEVLGHVVAVGDIKSEEKVVPCPGDMPALRASSMRTTSTENQARFVEAVDAAKASGDTVGGVAEVLAWNVPLGLGSHVSSDQKLDARIAAALMSIQSAKAVEIGDGFKVAELPGSLAHDQIVLKNGCIGRSSNRAGGIEGGTSNGEVIRVSVAFKPISTVPKALGTVNMRTGEQTAAFHQRSDTSQIVPGAVVAQAMVELVLAQVLTERFGGRSVEEVRKQLQVHCDYVRSSLTATSVPDSEHHNN